VISFQNAFGERVIGAAQQVPQTRWLVLITLSQPEVTRAAEQFLYRMAGIGVVLVVAGIFFAWLIGRSITQPLNKLTRAAEAIAKGNYDLQLRIRRRDELGKLANAFNTMTLTRKKYEEDLRFLGEQLRQLATHLQNVREKSALVLPAKYMM
jgi:nitrogen fixation/metabolism regulation signal transduction histidine kinase